MESKFFGHQAVSQRLSKKLQDWYGATTTVTHGVDSSTLQANGLTFIISHCRQYDSHNGGFRLTQNGKLIDINRMYGQVMRIMKLKTFA